VFRGKAQTVGTLRGFDFRRLHSAGGFGRFAAMMILRRSVSIRALAADAGKAGIGGVREGSLLRGRSFARG
jgi:hypothetical protein